MDTNGVPYEGVQKFGGSDALVGTVNIFLKSLLLYLYTMLSSVSEKWVVLAGSEEDVKSCWLEVAQALAMARIASRQTSFVVFLRSVLPPAEQVAFGAKESWLQTDASGSEDGSGTFAYVCFQSNTYYVESNEVIMDKVRTKLDREQEKTIIAVAAVLPVVVAAMMNGSQWKGGGGGRNG